MKKKIILLKKEMNYKKFQNERGHYYNNFFIIILIKTFTFSKLVNQQKIFFHFLFKFLSPFLM